MFEISHQSKYCNISETLVQKIAYLIDILGILALKH